ncbi:MAG: AAA domain-containing protein [Cellulosilyticaceae bacterium]
MINNKIDQVTNLYRFLKAYHGMKSPVVVHQSEREWLEVLNEWPKHPCVQEQWGQQEIGKPICIIKKPTEQMLQKGDASRQVEAIYNSLYQLYTRLNKEPELIELVYGSGQVNVGGEESIDHPLLLQVVSLIFDPKIEAFALVLTDKEPELYHMLLGRGLGLSDEEAIEWIKLFQSQPISPLNKEQVKSFCLKLQEAVGEGSPSALDGQYTTLFLRKKQLGFHGAIEGIIEDLQKRKQVPPFIADLVGQGDQVRKNQTSKETMKRLALDVNGIDQKILFTKPANKEQLLVAKHLERNEAVLVQGPPGTGKTHTIANMIGHLLADGKRVLVTSYSEKALSVVKEQVIPELQGLCVSLTKDAQSRESLERTLEEIHNTRATLERSELARRVAFHEKNRETCIRNLEKLSNEMKNYKLIEYTPIRVAGKTYKPLEAAEYIYEKRGVCEWLPGPVKQGVSLPLEPSQIQELYHIKQSITQEECQVCELEVDMDQVLTPDQLQRARDTEEKFSQQDTPKWLTYFEEDPTRYEAQSLKSLIGELKMISGQLHLEAPWCVTALEAGRDAKTKEQWLTLAAQINEVYEFGLKHADELMAYAPSLGLLDPKMNAETLCEQLIQKIQGSGKVSKVLLLLNPQMKALIQASRVNGKQPETLDEFRALGHYVTLREKRAALKVRWERQMVPAGAPELSKADEALEVVCQKYGEAILKYLEWYPKKWLSVEKQLRSYGVDVEDLVAQQDFTKLTYGKVQYIYDIVIKEILEVMNYRLMQCEKREANMAKEQFETYLNRLEGVHSNQMIKNLCQAIKDKDVVSYKKAYSAFKEAKAKVKLLTRKTELIEKLSFAALGWSIQLAALKEVDEQVDIPHNIEEAWLWRQLEEALSKRHERSAKIIGEEIKEAQKRLSYHTKQLVCDKAWLHKLVDFDANRTEIQAIEGWKQLILKMGAGKGKQAELLKKEARKLMSKCQKAIPVWVMPLDKVADHFDPRENKFDVVIIDEASQADVTALIALYLGKQVLIVGDDEQVSPLAVGENTEEIQRLIKTYLEDIPNHYLYSGRFSIYDLAQLAGYQPVRLKEHFRCVPELIGYSNQLAYKGQIEPLREPGKILTPSLVTCYLPEGKEDGQINVIEAQTIVMRLLECLKDEAYTNKTFGVISLKGEKQAAYIDSLLQKEMTVGAYEQRKILCGGPAHFQGDERDVIFISMVDAKTDQETLRLMTYGSDNLYKKRYNVAMSRGRDQVFIMHSFDPEVDLKEEDLRRELFGYCVNYGKEQQSQQSYFEEPLQPFEEMLKAELVAHGFRVRSHKPSGQRLIGLVVEGEKKDVRLVCESEKYQEGTDLEAEINNLAVLERIGWEIIYQSASRFYQDPKVELVQLIAEIEKLTAVS